MDIDVSSSSPRTDCGSAEWYRLHRGIPTRCRVPAKRIAALDFQRNPLPLEIDWIREEHAGFFRILEEIPEESERAEAFHDYALRRFWAHDPPDHRPDAKERARRGYISLLREWGYDSNSPSGAVLKGWAEQRFGLRPVWHDHILDPGETERDQRYLGDRLRGHLHGIGMQLDLLYTYCQLELRRRFGARTAFTLYRGCFDPKQHHVRTDANGEIVEFNAVSSFTDDPEVAWEFGSTVWRVTVPFSKIMLAPGILPPRLLQGEREVLVLGGEYRVEPLLY